VQVRQGWSGETDTNKWAKFDITLAEEDLIRILGPDLYNAVTVPITLAFGILEAEAEWLVYAKLVTRYGFDPTEGAAVMDRLRASRNKLVDRVREIERA
jgi:hypothetical protein